MKDVRGQVMQRRQEFEQALKSAVSIQDVEKVRVEFLGRKGFIQDLMSALKDLSVDEKRECGPLLQEFKITCDALCVERKQVLEQAAFELDAQKQQNFDVTASIAYDGGHKGHLHVCTQLIEEIENIFLSMGYSVLDGPEVEDDFHNFSALNIPKNHPARDLQDTLWLNQPDRLLRTHTSNVQIRTLQEHGVPLAGISAGRVYRNEAVDATHDATFFQCEGVFVDKGVNMAHLLGVVQQFLSCLFGVKDLNVRFRPSYYPFVEPGMDIEMKCVFCTAGCNVCKRTMWIEIAGSGMVHPHVLQSVGIDSDVYSGFAFGFGLSRLVMLRHKINDIRLLSTAHVGFSQQF